jgi:AraC family transcriptional regulator of arabinose operon
MSVADGFPGQRMLVLPRPRMREALQEPGTSHLVVTDCGYFPEAHSHGMVRSTPIAQAVVIVCVKGAGWCETPAGRFPVRAGQVIVLPPGHPHAYGSDPASSWTLWWLHLAGHDLPEFLAAAGMTTETPVRTPADVYRAASLVAEALQWMQRDSTTASLLASAGAAWHLMALLAADREADDGRAGAVEAAAEYLRTHIDDHVSVAELASMAMLSTSHFAALFKARLGFPVLQYQTQLRMARARELLDTTDRSIASVAAAAGYPDSFYFARQFKRVHGVTPLNYRRQHKG